MNKKNITTGIIFGGLILIIVVLSFVINGNKEKEEELTLLEQVKLESSLITDDMKKPFTKIDSHEYLEFFEGSEKTFIFVGRSGCNYCNIAEPIVQNIMKNYDVDVYYLSTDDFDEETEAIFMNSDESLNEFSTPLLLVVSDSTIHDRLEGLTTTEEYNNFFESNL